MTTWPEVLGALVAGTDLSAEQTAWAMGEILSGEATPAQIAGFAVALRAKGETIDEVAGLVEAMYAVATPISVPGRLLDVVGTGGDRSMSVNISTMAAIVAAGAGARVVKHGNRSASSQSGSADVLEAARHPARPRRPSGSPRWPSEAGITFCFAAAFHPAMRHAAVPRRELGIGTTFNFLGPLANPARAGAQAIGCADPRMAPVMAGVFARRGVDAWVFRGDDGLDELTTTTTSRVWWVHDGEVAREQPSTRRDLGIAARHHRGAARRRRGAQRRRRTPAARRRARRGARRRAAQRRRRARGVRRAAAPTRRGAGRRASTGPARRSTPAPRRPPSTAGSPPPAELAQRSSTYSWPVLRKPTRS